MTPRELLASPIDRDRERGRKLIANRMDDGWTRERALDTPIARRGRPTHRIPQDSGAPLVRDHAMGLAEIADVLGVSRERVRQIEEEALAKLRAALEAEGLTAHDVGDWLSRRPESESDRSVPSGGRKGEVMGLPDWRPEPLPVAAWSEHGQRVEAACAALDTVRERAQAYRAIERVVEGMAL